MILYVITDTYENSRDEQFWRHHFVLEEAAEDTCVPLHYSHLSPDIVARIDPWAICHSGGSAEYSEYDVLRHPQYRRLVTESPIPQIGFCGGHQIIASMFGSSLGHMRPLRPGEADLNAGYHGGLYKEWGPTKVRITERDPLFEGLADLIEVPEYHMDEVKDLSADLRLIATNDNCRVQAFVHRGRPIYGTQFHPEQGGDRHPDGGVILRNFFRLARSRA